MDDFIGAYFDARMIQIEIESGRLYRGEDGELYTRGYTIRAEDFNRLITDASMPEA